MFYHRVSVDPDRLAVSPPRFAEQMAFLAGSGIRAVDVAEVASLLAGGAEPTDVVGLSFDDGYLDVVENGAPVLAQHGFRASVFVSTAVTAGRARFSWYEHQPPLVSADDMRALDQDSPLRFEAHTRTHPNLVATDEATARDEIAGGREELEAWLGRPVDVFCYPGGLYGERERRLVATAGFTAAVTCEPGANRPDGDPLELRRVQVDSTDSLLDFRAKVGGGHDRPLPLRAGYRRLRYGVGRPRRASSRS